MITCFSYCTYLKAKLYIIKFGSDCSEKPSNSDEGNGFSTTVLNKRIVGCSVICFSL